MLPIDSSSSQLHAEDLLVLLLESDEGFFHLLARLFEENHPSLEWNAHIAERSESQVFGSSSVKQTFLQVFSRTE